MSTTTRAIDIEKIRSKGHRGVIVVQMMMAASDIALANTSMRPFMSDERRNARQLRYFFRLQCGHLREALKLIEKVESDPELSLLVKGCHPDARAAFADLKACAARNVKPKYQGLIHNIRNQTMAHYDGNLIEMAIARRAAHAQLATSSMTVGETFEETEYGIASDVEETLMVRYICKIPDSANATTAVDDISDFLGYATALAFKYVQFCAEFAHRCMYEFGAVK